MYKEVLIPNFGGRGVPKWTFSKDRETERQRPSHVFAKRLRETREARGFTQTELAQLVSDAGQPISKAALLRIERGERGLALDEALALAQVLNVAPAHLLSPPDDEQVWLTPSYAMDGTGLRNWLLFGVPILAMTEPGQRASARMKLAFNVEAYAQAIVDAKRGRDEEGKKVAIAALETAILDHQKEIERLRADENGE
jgi:transcriptional regulator with XRE-family HTH domain